MQYKSFLFIAFITALLNTGCEKYVNIKTQGSLVPGQWQNYRYLLNNTDGLKAGVAKGDYAGDDIQLVDGSAQQQQLANYDYYSFYPNCYSWQAVIYPLTGYYYQDQDWNNLYNTITNANVVIQEVPAVTDASESDKNELIAEALVHRADAYLALVNTYAKPYSSTTAASDLGVPLVLKETTTQSLSRSPIADVYAQIISDLKTAAPNLPASQLYTTLPARASAYGVLSRCYLYMNLYDSAGRYADSALFYQATLNDLGNFPTLDPGTYPLQKNDPEILLLKNADYGTTGYTPYALRLSDTLLHVLDTTDQRYILFTTDAATISSDYTDVGGRFFYKDLVMGESRNVGPTVSEMMLIKAEQYARSGDAATAINWVNKLRVKRFTAANYTALSATDADDALLKVIQERQREFFCRLLRWWDMRRLKSESRFQQTISRTYGGVTHTLAPNSDRYVFQIAPYNLKLNPEIQQNP